MNAQEREVPVDAYIAAASAERGAPENKQNSWAENRLSGLIRQRPIDDDSLQEVWDVLLTISQRSLSDKAIGCFAAGPLEDFLAHHGEAIIERVEVQARCDPDFKHLLGGVWQNAMSETVWKRVQTARGNVW